MGKIEVLLGCGLLISACAGSAQSGKGDAPKSDLPAAGGAPAVPSIGAGSAGAPVTASTVPAVDAEVGSALPLSDTCGRSSATASPDLQPQFDQTEAPPQAEGKDVDYDGPAWVERSDARALLLYFDAQGTSDAPPRHLSISTSTSTGVPVFPVGAELWLKATPSHNPHSAYYFSPAETWSLALRTARVGSLLLASGYTFNQPSSQPALAGLPFQVSAVTPVCKAMATSPFCAPWGPAGTVQVAYATLEIEGDSAVTIADGETKTVRLAGAAYDVGVKATAVVGAGTDCQKFDVSYPPSLYGGVAIDARAHDLQALIDALPVIELPSCTQGNALDPQTRLFANSSGDFEGTVIYSGTSADTIQLTSPDGQSFQIWKPPPSLVLPEVGAELWLKVVGAYVRLGMLRDKQGGKLLFAQAQDYELPLSQASSAELAEMGVEVSAEGGCVYSQPTAAAYPPVRLWSARFGPDTLVRSGALGEVEVAGQSYDAWVDGVGRLSFKLFPH